MTRVYLDTCIFRKLATDIETQSTIKERVESGRLEVVVSSVLLEELKAGPGGVPDFFPFTWIPEGVAVAGIAVAGAAKASDGELFKAHLGISKTNTNDAIVSATADLECEILVSGDRRNRGRLNKFGKNCKALTYDEFREWLRQN